MKILANKYCNLDGSKKIKDEYKKINIGFDKVETDVNNLDTKIDNVNSRVDEIITTPAEGVSAQEIIDARKGKPSLGAKIDEIFYDLTTHKAETSQQVNDLNTKKMDKHTDDISILQINKNKGKIDQTYLTDDLLQQMAGETPINAIPEKGSLTNEYIAPKAIGRTQTNFLQTGTNIFNKNQLISGYYISSTGTLITNSDYSVTEFYGVMPSTDYYANTEIAVGWYDETYTFISRDVKSGLLQSPSNAKYMRVAIYNQNIDALQISKSSSLLSKEEFYLKMPDLKVDTNQLRQYKSIGTDYIKPNSLTVFDTDFIEVGKNLFNKENVTNGYYISSANGSLVEHPDWIVCDYIPVYEGANYYCNYTTNLAFYDYNLKYISGNAGLVGGVTVPANARFIRVSTFAANKDIYQFELGEQGTEYEPFQYTMKNLVVENSNLKAQESHKYPVPARVEPELSLKGTGLITVKDVDKDGTLYGWADSHIIKRPKDSTEWIQVFNTVDSSIITGSIQDMAMLVSDTGRIIIGNTNGQFWVSNEEQTEFTEAFSFENGFTQLDFGYDKYQNILLFSSYVLSKSETNQGKELWLSTDYGATFNRIYYRQDGEITDPSDFHMHDVAYDPYGGAIILSIGDGKNRNIAYSYNFGETWSHMFDESEIAPIHPTSILCFPEGIAMGSDELPEGIYWWERPKNQMNPDIRYEDITYKIKFGKDTDTIIGTFAHKGDTLVTNNGFYGVMPFRNHWTETEGHARLFATGDGGRSWHEIFKDVNWDVDHKGFFNALLREESDGIYVYGTYNQLGTYYEFRAKLPDFMSI